MRLHKNLDSMLSPAPGRQRLQEIVASFFSCDSSKKILVLNSPVCAIIFDGINLRRQMKCIFFDKVNGIFNQRELQIKHHRQ